MLMEELKVKLKLMEEELLMRVNNDEDNKKKRTSGGSHHHHHSKKAGGENNNGGRCCQVERCTADLTDAKQYHRRHKVCELHAKAQVVIVAGIRQRFCQQCSRFHELGEFDETKRSCRRRLVGHNERRRKITAADFPAADQEGPSRNVDELGRI